LRSIKTNKGINLEYKSIKCYWKENCHIIDFTWKIANWKKNSIKVMEFTRWKIWKKIVLAIVLMSFVWNKMSFERKFSLNWWTLLEMKMSFKKNYHWIDKVNNRALPKALKELKSQLKGCTYSIFDASAVGTAIFNNPSKYGEASSLQSFLYLLIWCEDYLIPISHFCVKVSKRWKWHVVAVVHWELPLLAATKYTNCAITLANISSLIEFIQPKRPTINLQS
jgi:hypothetical protein